MAGGGGSRSLESMTTEIRGWKTVDLAQNSEDGLRLGATIAAVLALALGAAGVYTVLRWLEAFEPVWLGVFGAIIVALGLLAFAVHRLQEHGSVWFNVEKSRRGFRVVTRKK